MDFLPPALTRTMMAASVASGQRVALQTLEDPSALRSQGFALVLERPYKNLRMWRWGLCVCVCVGEGFPELGPE